MFNRKLKERNTKQSQSSTISRRKGHEVDEKLNREQLEGCLENNDRIPHHLRRNAKNILENIIYNITDEVKLDYTKVAVTTSLDPGSNLRTFSKHLSLVLNGENLIRSKMTRQEISEYCRLNKITHLILLNETKGNPSSMVICKYPYGKTYYFSLFNLKFERRQKSMKKRLHLIVDGMDSEIGEDLKKCLSLMCPAILNSKESGKYASTQDDDRVVAFINRHGTVAFRHFTVERRKLKKDCFFDLKLYKITNGTFEMEGDVDYVLNAFTNSVKMDVLKRDA